MVFVIHKAPQKPELPKPRDFFPEMGPRWLKVEPPRLATLGGLFFSVCAMLFYFARQCLGVSMAPEDIVLGVAKTFLVAYAGTGFLVWYGLRVADRELVKGDSDVEQSAEAEGEPLGEDVEDNGISPEESEE